MPLIIALIGFFMIKAVLELPFYFRQWKAALAVALITSLAVVPLITILYHETSIDFWFVYLGMIVTDILVFYFLIHQNWWKAVPAAFIINTIAIVFFYIGNG
ncbi:MAG TPA: hypothetical protein VFV31_10135 [Chitinophagaceae bacterium]|nr:hypothetical protein [Chitinophagaceae bacterium]